MLIIIVILTIALAAILESQSAGEIMIMTSLLDRPITAACDDGVCHIRP